MPSKEYLAAWHAKNPEKKKEYDARRREKCIAVVRDQAKARTRRWRARNPEKVKAEIKRSAIKYKTYRASWLLKKKYGITLEQRDALLASQGGICAGCNSETPNWKGDWHVDHCHTTGQIRGILCHNCNTTLGRAADNPAVLRQLACYLEQNTIKNHPGE